MNTILTSFRDICVLIFDFSTFMKGTLCLLCLSPLSRLGAHKLISGLHTQGRLLGSRIKTDNQGWSKMAKGKGPKPI